MRKTIRIIAAIIAAALLTSCAAQTAVESTTDTAGTASTAAAETTAALSAEIPEELRIPDEDVDKLLSDLEQFKSVLAKSTGIQLTPEEIAAKTDALAEDIKAQRISTHDVTHRLMEIIGENKNSHLGIWGYMGTPYAVGEYYYPLQVTWFDEGAVVIEANDKSIIGAVLVSIDGHTVDEILEKQRAIYSEVTDVSNLTNFTYQMSSSTMQYLGITDGGAAEFRFRTLDGKELTTVLEPTNSSELYAYTFRDEGESTLAARLYADNGCAPYLYYYDEKNRALYFQYTECTDVTDGGQTGEVLPFGDFLKDMSEFAKEHSDIIDTFVVDLRSNGGGNANLLMPLFNKYLLRYRGIRTAVLVNKNTYSSATMAACRFIALFPNVTVYGEETGETVDFFGDAKFEDLGEEFEIKYSTSEIKDMLTDERQDGARGVIPDVEVGRSYAKYVQGIDEAYNAAVSGQE